MTDCKNCKFTDEYCTSGDCNKIQANNLACNKISLTEQLKSGYYYIRLDGEYGVHIDFYNSENDDWDKYYPSNIVHIYSRVPYLDEVEQLLDYKRIVTSYNMKPIDYDIACETINKLLDENTKLKEQIEHANRLIKWVRHSSWSCDQEEDDFDRYVKKWGVE